MNTDSLIDFSYGGEKGEINFEFTSFNLSREGVRFIEAEIERFDLANQLKILADKIDAFINYLKKDNSNIKDKKELLSILNHKKIRLFQCSNKYKEAQEKYISDYNYYSNLLKIYEKNTKKIKSKVDKKLILNSSYSIQYDIGEKLIELCKIHDNLLGTFYDEEEIIQYFFNKYNYKY